MHHFPKLILFDLDGILSVGNQAIPGAIAFLSQLCERGIALRFIINTSTKSQSELVEQVRRSK